MIAPSLEESKDGPNRCGPRVGSMFLLESSSTPRFTGKSALLDPLSVN